jgi:ankyrin repeat protein
MYVCIYVCMYVCMYVYIYTHIHTHIYICQVHASTGHTALHLAAKAGKADILKLILDKAKDKVRVCLGVCVWWWKG